MTKDNLDKLIEKTFENDADKFKDIRDIEVPDFEAVMKKVRSQVEACEGYKSSKGRKARYLNMRVAVLAASFTLIILISSTILPLLMDNEHVSAFKNRVLKTSIETRDKNTFNISISGGDKTPPTDNGAVMNKPVEKPSEKQEVLDRTVKKLTREELASKISFPVIVPGFLPDGYTFKEAEWSTFSIGDNSIKQTYLNTQKQSLVLTQTTYNEDSETKKTVVSSRPASAEVVEIMGVEGVLVKIATDGYQISWIKNGYQYEIYARCTEDDFLKLIKGLKYTK